MRVTEKNAKKKKLDGSVPARLKTNELHLPFLTSAISFNIDIRLMNHNTKKNYLFGKELMFERETLN